MQFDEKKLFGECEELLSQKLGSALIFITRKRQGEAHSYEFRRVLLDVAVQESFRKDFLAKISSIRRELKKKLFEEYTAINHPDCIQYLNKKRLQATLLEVPIEEVPVIAANDLNTEFFGSLWGYVVVFTNKEGKELQIFRRYTPGNVLKKSLLNALIIRDGSFTKLDRDIFKIDYKIHSFLIKDFLIIFSKRAFEELFELEEHYKKHAKEVLREIRKSGVAIRNFAGFSQKCCENIHMMRKLSNSKAKETYKKITFRDIITMKKKYHLRFEIDHKKKEIYYTRYAAIWDILALFDDDLLESCLTGKKYEVGSKRER